MLSQTLCEASSLATRPQHFADHCGRLSTAKASDCRRRTAQRASAVDVRARGWWSRQLPQLRAEFPRFHHSTNKNGKPLDCSFELIRICKLTSRRDTASATRHFAVNNQCSMPTPIRGCYPRSKTHPHFVACRMCVWRGGGWEAKLPHLSRKWGVPMFSEKVNEAH